MLADVHLIATGRTLDGFASLLGDADGVDVRELAAGAIVIVRTRHSRYRLVMVEPETQRVLVSGGDWFPAPTEAQLVGATGGGSMLKPGWIGVGLRMELRHMNQRITTSLVDAVTDRVVPSRRDLIGRQGYQRLRGTQTRHVRTRDVNSSTSEDPVHTHTGDAGHGSTASCPVGVMAGHSPGCRRSGWHRRPAAPDHDRRIDTRALEATVSGSPGWPAASPVPQSTEMRR